MALSPAVAAAVEAILTGASADEQETATLEFKSVGRSSKETDLVIAQAVACLANAMGGAVVVGVRDDGRGSEALEGCELAVDLVQRRIYELTDPPLVLGVEAHAVAGARLLVVTVPGSPDVHAVRGRSTERIGKSCREMSTARIAQVVGERRGDDWSAGDSGRPVDAASTRAFEEARRLLATAPDPVRRRYATLGDADLLSRLGLVHRHGTLTHAGALLFAGGDEGSGGLAYVFRRTASGELVANERLRGPLLPAVVRILELIDARVDRTPVNFPGGQQQQLADLPDAAVREAVVNAVMHRDYRLPAEVHVEHAPTRLAVTSPGSLVSGVTLQNLLTTAPRARNASLVNAIRTVGLGEAAGVGVDRMYAAMARIGHQPPVFDADLDRVRVTLLGGSPNAFVARFVATLPEEHAEAPDTMLVLLTLLTHRTTTAAEMAPLLQRPESETANVMEQLVAEPVAMIERTRATARQRSGVYRLREHVISALGPAVGYRRRTQDESDRKIIAMVRETTEINGRMVRLMLDVDTVTASRLLADLVERGILAKTSKAQRGPGVTYGAGPAFPRRPRRVAAGDRGNQA